MKTFIKDMRLSYNLTQAELAKLVGVSKSTVSSWETDICYPSLYNAVMLSKVFNCSLNDIFSKINYF